MIDEIGPTELGVVFRPFADRPIPFGLWLRRLRRNASPLAQQFADHCCQEAGNSKHVTAAG
jgi:hypothetical protein